MSSFRADTQRRAAAALEALMECHLPAARVPAPARRAARAAAAAALHGPGAPRAQVSAPQLRRRFAGLSLKLRAHGHAAAADALAQLAAAALAPAAGREGRVESEGAAAAVLALLAALAERAPGTQYAGAAAGGGGGGGGGGTGGQLRPHEELALAELAALARERAGDCYSAADDAGADTWSDLDDEPGPPGAPPEPVPPRAPAAVDAAGAAGARGDHEAASLPFVRPMESTVGMLAAVQELRVALADGVPATPDLLPESSYRRTMQLGKGWAAHERATNCFKSALPEPAVISDARMVQEIMWSLARGRPWALGAGRTLRHATPPATDAALLVVNDVADAVCAVEDFATRDHGAATALTPRALSGALRAVLNAFRADLCSWERDGPLTLLGLRTRLDGAAWLLRLRQARAWVRTAISALDAPNQDGPFSEDPNAAARVTTQLIQQLLIAHADAAWEKADPSHSVAQVTADVALRTLRPFLHFLETWLYQGVVDDPYQEFCFQVGILSVQEDGAWPQLVLLRGFGDVKDATGRGLIPRFLDTMASDLMRVGKSTLVLFELETMPLLPPRPLSLFAKLAQALGLDNEPTAQQTSSSGPVYPTPLREIYAADDDHSGLLLAMNAEQQAAQSHSALTPIHFTIPSTATGESEAPAPLQVWHTVRTLEALLQSILRESLGAISPVLDAQLLGHLRGKFGLETRLLGLLQDVFLMRAGDALHIFSSDLFSRHANHVFWRGPIESMAMLADAWASTGRNPGALESVGVTFGPDNEDSEEGSWPFSQLHLSCKVEWPLSLAVESEDITAYNRVFQLLLRVQHAVWALEGLQVRQAKLTDPFVNPARLHQLRWGLLHVIRGFYRHVLDRILVESASDLTAALEAAPHLDAWREAHRAFLATVLARCLLQPAAVPVLRAVFRVLSLATRFAVLWAVLTGNDDTMPAERGPDAPIVTAATISALDAEFYQCCLLLRNALRSYLRGGGQPQFETLLGMFDSVLATQL